MDAKGKKSTGFIAGVSRFRRKSMSKAKSAFERVTSNTRWAQTENTFELERPESNEEMEGEEVVVNKTENEEDDEIISLTPKITLRAKSKDKQIKPSQSHTQKVTKKEKSKKSKINKKTNKKVKAKKDKRNPYELFQTLFLTQAEISPALKRKINNGKERSLKAIDFWLEHKNIQIDVKFLEEVKVEKWLSKSCQDTFHRNISDKVIWNRLLIAVGRGNLEEDVIDMFPWDKLWKIKENSALANQEICYLVEFSLSNSDFEDVFKDDKIFITEVKEKWLKSEFQLEPSFIEKLARLPWSCVVYQNFFRKCVLNEGSDKNLEFLMNFDLEESFLLTVLQEENDLISICAKTAAMSFHGIISQMSDKKDQYEVALSVIAAYINKTTFQTRYLAIQETLELWYKSFKKTKSDNEKFISLLTIICSYDVEPEELQLLFSAEVLNFAPQKLLLITYKKLVEARYIKLKSDADTVTPAEIYEVMKINVQNHYDGVSEVSEEVNEVFLKQKSSEDIKNYVKSIKVSKDKEIIKKYKIIKLILLIVKKAKKNETINKYSERQVQVCALIGLIFGKEKEKRGLLAQISTGEGKTLIVAMLSIFHILYTEVKVDVITSSEELSAPQERENQLLFGEFGITSGIVDVNCTEYEKQKDKQNLNTRDVLYGTPSSFMRLQMEKRHILSVDRPFDRDQSQTIVIIDEVDNLLFDKRNASLQITSPEGSGLFGMLTSLLMFIHLKTGKNLSQEDIEKEFSEKFLDSNKDKKANNSIIPDFLLELVKYEYKEWISNSIKARFVYQDDVSYYADEVLGKVIKIDQENTGVLQPNMLLSQGLSQFLHIEKRFPVDEMSCTSVFQTFVSYFLSYKAIYGVTGTIGSEFEFLDSIYNINHFKVPRHFTCSVIKEKITLNYNCLKYTPRVLRTREKWLQTVIEAIKVEVLVSRPVLVICSSIKVVETLRYRLARVSNDFIVKKIIIYDGKSSVQRKHLNAKEIMLATNIAGRGTDILFDKATEPLGGLHVCLTFLPNNYRVELQNVGRTARSGRRGSSQIIAFRSIRQTSRWEAIEVERQKNTDERLKKAMDEMKHLEKGAKLAELFYSKRDLLFQTLRHKNKEKLFNLISTQFEFKNLLLFGNAIGISVSRNNFFNEVKESLPVDINFENAFLQNNVLKLMTDEYHKTKDNYKHSDNWTIHEYHSVNQRWGLWLAQNWSSTIEKHPSEDSSDIDNKIKLFLDELESDANTNRLIKNPVYYIHKGYSIIDKDEVNTLHIAKECFDKAIEIGKDYIAYSYYYRAYYTWIKATSVNEVINDVITDLTEAKKRVLSYFIPMYKNLLIITSTSSPLIENKMSETFKALLLIHTLMAANIEQNISQLKKFKKESLDENVQGAPSLSSLEHRFGKVSELQMSCRQELVWSQCKSFGLVGVFNFNTKPKPKDNFSLESFMYLAGTISVLAVGVYTRTPALINLAEVALMNIDSVQDEGISKAVLETGVDFTFLTANSLYHRNPWSAFSIYSRNKFMQRHMNKAEITKNKKTVVDKGNDLRADILSFVNNDDEHVKSYEAAHKVFQEKKEYVAFHLNNMLVHVYEQAVDQMSKNELLLKALALDNISNTHQFEDSIKGTLFSDNTDLFYEITDFLQTYAENAFELFEKKQKSTISCEELDLLIEQQVDSQTENILQLQKQIEACFSKKKLSLAQKFTTDNHRHIIKVSGELCEPLIIQVENVGLEALEECFGIVALKENMERSLSDILEQIQEYSNKIGPLIDEKEQENCICCQDIQYSTNDILRHLSEKYEIAIGYYSQKGLLCYSFVPTNGVIKKIMRISRQKVWEDLDQNKKAKCLIEHLESFFLEPDASVMLIKRLNFLNTPQVENGENILRKFVATEEKNQSCLEDIINSFHKNEHSSDPLQLLAQIRETIHLVVGLNCSNDQRVSVITESETSFTELQAFRK